MSVSDKGKAGERLRIFNDFALVGQFGLSLVTPLILCLFLSYMLFSRNITGGWVFIPGFILGIGASAMTAYKFYLYVLRKESRKSSKIRRKGVYFNRHI